MLLELGFKKYAGFILAYLNENLNKGKRNARRTRIS